jgi:hypothetical protein
MIDPKIDKMVNSGVFPDDSSAAYADAMFHNLRQSNSGPLIDAKTGKEYTASNFPKYLVDRCKVKPENVKKAMGLLYELSR